MSSYLEKQSSAFRGTLASAAAKLSNPSSTSAGKATVLAPPSPSPSAASDSTTPKRSKAGAAGAAGTTGSALAESSTSSHVPFSQPQLTGYGAEVKTQMTFAVEYLKKKADAKSMTDIIDHLSLRAYGDEHKRELAQGLRGHPRVAWTPDAALAEQTWRSGIYKYCPVIRDVYDGESLLAHLQRKTDASGLSVKDLKDGWPDCEATLAELEAQHRILVVRTKKDNLARAVWLDDPSLHHRVQPEFQGMWGRVPLPSIDDMHRKLVNVGQKPTSEDPLKIQQAAAKPKIQKKRARKGVGKATNVHMAHLMQDYSNLRR
ncbi:Transcription initiation factor TFIIE, beta subunit [Moelleriella libera RCEF 2490]|uniref:Transcription initiation factor IIE subunit beta n=1 Tax=Moelleriella libera RCEF 2490 TaxID=1081109 RepID=A0A168CMV3_9HYPO|nr:Transcription initiation factor TFIIE, beta subunit [Moelleriella libera RCEF 2490]